MGHFVSFQIFNGLNYFRERRRFDFLRRFLRIVLLIRRRPPPGSLIDGYIKYINDSYDMDDIVHMLTLNNFINELDMVVNLFNENINIVFQSVLCTIN